MNYFFNYLIDNFVLICIVIVLGFTLIKKFKTHRRTSIYLLIILSFTLLISILDAVQMYVEYEVKSIFATTFLAALLYVLRPITLLCFIFLSGQKFKGVWFYVLLVPLALNVIVNIFPFIEATKTWTFYYKYSEVDGKIGWVGGDIALFRFTPHIVSVFYLLFLLNNSFRLIKRKHFADAIGIVICASVVSIATIIETFFNDSGDINLLPSSIAVSTVFYYLFLYERSNKIDVLTGLFNRASYFDDFDKLARDITGIIQFDMNGLKYLNDNYGHLEGDKGLQRIAKAINNNSTRKMYAYRLGGDEFIVLAIGESEERIMKFISAFRKEVSETKYYCSIGYACKNKAADNVDKMFKLSEERMYLDKAEFYKTAKFERRKTDYIHKE